MWTTLSHTRRTDNNTTVVDKEESIQLKFRNYTILQPMLVGWLVGWLVGKMSNLFYYDSSKSGFE